MIGRSTCGSRVGRLSASLMFAMALPVSAVHAQLSPHDQPVSSTSADPHDFSGMWAPARFAFQIPDAPVTPAVKARLDGYKAEQKKGHVIYTAWTSCRPGVVSAMVMPMNSIVIMQSPHAMTLLFEEPRMARRIRLDATHPADLKPSYMGDSVAHWEGDTLVIDTVGLNGHMELDAQALPAGPKMHTVERLKKSTDGSSIENQITFTDPDNYTRPFTIERIWKRSSDRHPLEYGCMDNPREEDFENTVFVQDLYRPTCKNVQGKGMELSKIVCLKPEELNASGREN